MSDLLLTGIGGTKAPASAVAATPKSIDLERGSTQWLSRTDISGTNNGGNITMEAWIKLESQPANLEQWGIVTVVSDASPYIEYSLIYEGVTGTNKLRFNRGRSCVANAYTSYDINLTTGQWYHVAATYDGTNVRVYLDGTLVAGPTAQSGNGDVCGSAETTIGKRDSVDGTTFDGLIDDVRLWTTVRTVTEINDNKSVEIDTATGLVASWHLNNDLLDATGNGRTLTNNGAAVFSSDVPF